MGIFDRIGRLFGSEPPASPEPTTAPKPPPPDLPAKGKIASFDVQDGIGSLVLASGEELRFGRTACNGFEPAAGASVIVEDVTIGANATRYRAIRVSLDPTADDYEGALAKRDAAHGLKTGPASNEEAIATTLSLAVVTVLLREPLPVGNAALRAWADALGLPTSQIGVGFVPDLAFSLPGGISLTYPGRTAFPRAETDATAVPMDFDFGASFIGLGTGLRDLDRQFRIVNGSAPDVWAEDGKMRKLSRLISALAPVATGVVLHRAGNLVVPITTFIEMLGDLDDAACVPFAAWLDAGLVTRDSGKRYGTFGMDAFGLPDVYVEVSPGDAYDRARAHEAALFACYTMVRENRELATGEVLRVPVRARVGAFPLPSRQGVATRDYTVTEDGSHLGLERFETRDDAQSWLREGVALAPAIYQALFDHGLDAHVPSAIIRDVGANGGEVPHRVEVRERHDGCGYLTVTNGFGRAPHPRIERSDCKHFEVAAWSEEHAFWLLDLIGSLADNARTSPLAGWKPGDTLAAPVAELGIAGFLVADGGAIDMGPGPSVRLLLLVPLLAEDYAHARGGGGLAWLAAHPPSGLEWTPFLSAAKREAT